jgi:hypothetical protein
MSEQGAQALVRWGGVALLAGGVVGAAGTVVQPASPLLEATLDRGWMWASMLYVISNILIQFGLVGVYLRLAKHEGILGFLAFVLAFTCTAVATALVVLAAFAYPYIALQPNAPELLSDVTAPGGPLATEIPFDTAFTILDIGFVLLSIVIIRARVILPAAGWVLLATTVLTNIFPVNGAWWQLGMASQVIWALALAWIGYLLITPPELSRRPRPAL